MSFSSVPVKEADILDDRVLLTLCLFCFCFIATHRERDLESEGPLLLTRREDVLTETG